MFKKLMMTLAILTTTITGSQAAELTGAGSSFVAPLVTAWAKDYQAEANITINYQAVGSGAGIKQIIANTVDFSMTDKPLGQEDLATNNLTQTPIVAGGVVVVVNLPGVDATTINLTGQNLVDIYNGTLTNWKQLDLPDMPITVVHRSDGSGTSYLFTKYLSKISADWADAIGSDTSVEWPTGLGGKGNDGVANVVKQQPGSIGYVEYTYAIISGLQATQLNGVEAKPAAFKAAIDSAPIGSDNLPDLIGVQGTGVWPIVGITYLLTHTDSDVKKDVDAFFDWALAKRANLIDELHYIKL